MAITCFNRRESTLACLRSLFAQSAVRAGGVSLSVVVVDDGSSDGSAGAIADQFPMVDLVRAPGDLYWAAGMRAASETLARNHPEYDFMLWLNDDVELDDDALERALGASDARGRSVVVVGATRDPVTGATTYSGFRKVGRRPLQIARVEAADAFQSVDTINGNFALIPRRAVDVVGLIDGRYAHAYADLDYGYSLNKAGFATLVLPRTIGTCEANRKQGDLNDVRVRRGARMRMIVGRKGLPPRSLYLLYRAHGGFDWPLYFVAGYVVAAIRVLRRRPIS